MVLSHETLPPHPFMRREFPFIRVLKHRNRTDEYMTDVMRTLRFLWFLDQDLHINDPEHLAPFYLNQITDDAVKSAYGTAVTKANSVPVSNNSVYDQKFRRGRRCVCGRISVNTQDQRENKPRFER